MLGPIESAYARLELMSTPTIALGLTIPRIVAFSIASPPIESENM
jgi:hypothetical protein